MFDKINNFFNEIGVSVLIEGSPYDDKLSETEYIKITHAIAPISEKIKRISNILDYDTLKIKGNYVFIKRYSNQNDIPTCTDNEIKYLISNIESKCNQYTLGNQITNNTTPDIYAMQSFYKELTTIQKNSFISTGIRFQELIPSQKTHIERLLLNNYFNPILIACFQARIMYSETESSQISIHNKKITSSFYRTKKISTRILFPNNHIPDNSKNISEAKWDRTYSRTTTLSEYIKISKRKIQADDILRDKPLHFLGKNCSDNVFLAMLSALYPHKAIQMEGYIKISSKAFSPNIDFQRITDSFLPETLRRYIFPSETPDKAGLSSHVRTNVFPTSCNTAIEKDIIEELKKETIHYSKLSPFQRRCIMLRFLNPVVSALVRQNGAVPSYISQMSQLLIQGKTYSFQGRTWLTVTFAVPEGPLGVPRVRLTMSQIPLTP